MQIYTSAYSINTLYANKYICIHYISSLQASPEVFGAEGEYLLATYTVFVQKDYCLKKYSFLDDILVK